MLWIAAKSTDDIIFERECIWKPAVWQNDHAWLTFSTAKGLAWVLRHGLFLGLRHKLHDIMSVFCMKARGVMW